MFTYNVTFVVSPAQEKSLINYLKQEVIPEIVSPELPELNIELKKVVEAGGVKPGPEHGLSIAMSASFDTEEIAHLWHDHTLIPCLDEFQKKFGDQSIFFITLLEKI